MSIADDPQALARYVEHLGGEIVPAATFRFRIPLAEARRIVPEINRLGLRCAKVNEYTDNDLNGHSITVATIELGRQPEEKSDHEQARSLMAAVIR